MPNVRALAFARARPKRGRTHALCGRLHDAWREFDDAIRIGSTKACSYASLSGRMPQTQLFGAGKPCKFLYNQ